MQFANFFLISTLVSIIPGQLIRLPIFSQLGALTLADIYSLLCFFSFTIYSLYFKKTIIFPFKIFYPALLFMMTAFTSSILSLNSFSLSEVAVGITFQLRFFLYFWLFIAAYNLIEKNKIENWINLTLVVGFIFAIIGVFQILLFPDLSFLSYYGWDPHIRRITSSFLDPNFAGAIFTALGSLSICLFLFKKKLIYFIYFTFIFILQILTFSRSSYLSFIVMLFTIGILKSPKVLIGAILAFVLVFFSISQARERIIGAFNLDETSQARIQSWQNALIIFKDHPLFGVGFNNYRVAQAKYGFFSTDNPQGGHSGSGVDSSLLLVLATTGVTGAFFYLMLLASIFSVAIRKIRESYLNLAFSSLFLGLIVHSQFVNSLFFPQILVIFWVILALVVKNDS